MGIRFISVLSILFFFYSSTSQAGIKECALRLLKKHVNLSVDPRLTYEKDKGFSLRVSAPEIPGVKILDFAAQRLRYFLGLSEFYKTLEKVNRDKSDTEYFQKLANAFQLKVFCDEEKLSQIPKTGPVMIVLNHPLSGHDTIAMASLIRKVRPDVKVVIGELLRGLPGLDEHAIWANPYEGPNAKATNKATVKQSIDWLREGHALILHPAGDISWVHDPTQPYPVDPKWYTGAAIFASQTKTPIIPAFVHGQASEGYIENKEKSPVLSALHVIPQLNKQKGMSIGIAFGDEISHTEYNEHAGLLTQLTQFLREKVYALSSKEIPGFEGRKIK